MEAIADTRKKTKTTHGVANNVVSNPTSPVIKRIPNAFFKSSACFSSPLSQKQPLEKEELQTKPQHNVPEPWIQTNLIEGTETKIQQIPLFGLINVSHSVQLIPQPTTVSCWAAALAMIASFRDDNAYSPATIATQAFMDLTTGYGWPDIRNAVDIWNLSETAPASAMPPYWAEMLEEHGPLWVVEVGAPYHAVVLAGIFGTGSLNATQVTVYNPWPPNVGAVEYKTFEDFDQEFGEGAGAGAMIVHA